LAIKIRGLKKFFCKLDFLNVENLSLKLLDLHKKIYSYLQEKDMRNFQVMTVG